MKLAVALGRTLDELERTMSAEEFGMWAALNRVDPWDYTRQDVGAGIVAATVANYAGKMRKQNAEPAKPIDFMPFLHSPSGETEEPDPAQHFGAFLKDA